jgi:ParB family chromosome partitioning protein
MSKMEIEPIPLDRIDISKWNARKSNAEENIEELAKSIKEIGLQQPVVVIKKGDRYDLIIGQRRFLAFKRLGRKEIPAIVRTVENDTQAAILSFSENIHRLDLEYEDKMQIAIELLSKLGSVKKVADHLGVNPQTVRNWLGFVGVPDEIKKMVKERKLGARTAVRITRDIEDEKMAVEIAKRIKEVPSSTRREMIIDTARQNPEKSIKEVIKIASKRKYTKITINLTSVVSDALEKACVNLNSAPEDITVEALEEWLHRRGFI